MAFLKRAFYSMRHSWLKNLFVIIMFTVLFACCVGFLVVYATSSKQLATVRESTACAVTLKAPFYMLKGIGRSAAAYINKTAMESYLDDPSVVGYSYTDFGFAMLQDAEPLYAEEAKQVSRNLVFDVPLIMLVNSEKDKPFSLYGYNLVEGRHFTPEDNAHVCLVSQEFAALNGLQIGSTFSMQRISAKPNTVYPFLPVEVVGIYDAPESIHLKGYGEREEEIIFTPTSFAYELSPMRDPEDVLYNSFTAYLKSPEDIPGFIERVKEKLPITEVWDSYFSHDVYERPPERYAGMSIEELWEEVHKNPTFQIQLNQEWYDMTMGPTEKMNQLAGGMTLAFLVASALVLVLVNTLLLKNKRWEFGMLCAMGEGRLKIALQAAVEMAVPIIVAMLLGLAIGIAVGVPLAENLTTGVYEQHAADMQGLNNMVTYAHTQQNFCSFEILRGSAWNDLLMDELPAVVVPPQPKAQVDGAAVGAYFAAVLALALVAVLIQAGAVLRLKPAKILTGKG